MTGRSVLLQATGLRKAFADPAAPTSGRAVLDGLSLTIRAGASLGITGPSGVGKSTLGRILARRETADAGGLTIAGEPVDPTRLHVGRRPAPVQYVPQAVVRSFHPQRRVGDALEELIHCARRHREGRARLRERMREWLAHMALSSASLRRLPARLSGGELQRLAIVRALLVSPRVLVLDEPSAALDLLARERLALLVRWLCEHEELGLLIITHDLRFARRTCDDVRMLRGGRLTTAIAGAE